jgi:mitotic spindle assembly checkpoint protein MAD2
MQRQSKFAQPMQGGTELIGSFHRDIEPVPEKTEKEIQAEIQAIFRQITASVTFLPQLDGECTFNVLVYADADSEVPLEWGDSDAKEIKDAENVQLRSFSTSSHKVDTLVSYRYVYATAHESIS